MRKFYQLPIFAFLLIFTSCNIGKSFTDDRDGKSYRFVKICNQTWMAQNLAYLPSVNHPDDESSHDPCYYVFGYVGTNVTEAQQTAPYLFGGALYNWEAALTACPEGWHLPTDVEWQILEQCLEMNPSEATAVGNRLSGEVGRKLKSASGWENQGNGDNSAGYHASGTGRMHSHGFVDWNISAYFWSQTPYQESKSWIRSLNWNSNGINRYQTTREQGFSIRCIKNPELPIVSNVNILSITLNSADGEAESTDNGGDPIIQRGMCWNTTGSPTIGDNSIIDNNLNDSDDTGSFTITLSDLQENVIYHVRAYATNSVGTAYSPNDVRFTIFPACGNIVGGTFTDGRIGHVREYEYVTIGNQTWMAENLAYIPHVSPPNQQGGIWVYGYDGTDVNAAKGNDNSNYNLYGCLYDWNTATAIDAEGQSIICPTGWKLPSDDDWKDLEICLGMIELELHSEGVRSSGDVGRKLKSSTGWNNDGNGNNRVLFNGRPSGFREFYFNTSFNYIGICTYFWTSSLGLGQGDNIWNLAATRSLSYQNDGVGRENRLRVDGLSVRCIKE